MDSWLAGRRSSIPLLGVILVAALLRLYPIHVAYLNPDQGLLPSAAIEAFERGDWEMRSRLREYPTGLLFTLRAAYTVGYWIANARGVVDSREDFISL